VSRHPNQNPLTVIPDRKDLIKKAAKKRVFAPARYGSWYEEMMREREEQMNRAPEDRPGEFRTVANGDFSEEEICELEKKYGAPIVRPKPKEPKGV
jgi:hypothetical protein